MRYRQRRLVQTRRPPITERKVHVSRLDTDFLRHSLSESNLPLRRSFWYLYQQLLFNTQMHAIPPNSQSPNFHGCETRLGIEPVSDRAGEVTTPVDAAARVS